MFFSNSLQYIRVKRHKLNRDPIMATWAENAETPAEETVWCRVMVQICNYRNVIAECSCIIPELSNVLVYTKQTTNRLKYKILFFVCVFFLTADWQEKRRQNSSKFEPRPLRWGVKADLALQGEVLKDTYTLTICFSSDSLFGRFLLLSANGHIQVASS